MEQHHIHSRSYQSRLLNLFLRTTIKPALTSGRFDPARSGAWLDRIMQGRKMAQGVECSIVDNGRVKGEWLRPPRASSARANVLYIHGGGYFMGSAQAYRGLTSRLAELARAPVFSLDYRLAPEHPFPAAVEDAVAAYEWLLQQRVNPEGMVVAGDSAGGGICLALIHALKERSMQLPARLTLFSPWTDLATTGASLHENSRGCALFNALTVEKAAAYYLRGGDPYSPLASPLHGDLKDFPPMHIHVSDSEAIRDDSLRLAHKAELAGVEVTLSIWHRQVHAWPAFYPLLPEAEYCLEELADCVRDLEEELNPVVVPLRPRRQHVTHRPGA